MNVDSIFSYLIFLGLVISVVYFLSSVYPNFGYLYSLEEIKYQKAIAKYDLGKNYEVITTLKCVNLPNYFKNNEIEINGNYIMSNVSYRVYGYAMLSNGELKRGIVPKETEAYVYGSKVCFDLPIAHEFHGNKTSYSVTFTETYFDSGFEFEKLYRKWLE